jgi:hypothetical protein
VGWEGKDMGQGPEGRAQNVERKAMDAPWMDLTGCREERLHPLHASTLHLLLISSSFGVQLIRLDWARR